MVIEKPEQGTEKKRKRDKEKKRKKNKEESIKDCIRIVFDLYCRKSAGNKDLKKEEEGNGDIATMINTYPGSSAFKLTVSLIKIIDNQIQSSPILCMSMLLNQIFQPRQTIQT